MYKVLILWFFSLAAWGSEQHCDIIGENLRSLPKVSQEACVEACTAETACVASVYVSGWRRCFLKKSFKRKASIKFYSEQIKGQSGYDLDFTGKDLRRLVLADKAMCRQSCLDEAQCTGYTYIEGYKDCWLKHTPGRLVGKIFFCSTKPGPKAAKPL